MIETSGFTVGVIYEQVECRVQCRVECRVECRAYFTVVFMFHLFYDRISVIIDKHIPVKQITQTELKLNSKPWIMPALKRSIQIKNKWHKKFLKTKSIYYYNKFKYYRNKLNHLLKLSKKQYYNKYFLDNKHNSKNLWKVIKQIVHFKPQSYHKFIKIVENSQKNWWEMLSITILPI